MRDVWRRAAREANTARPHRHAHGALQNELLVVCVAVGAMQDGRSIVYVSGEGQFCGVWLWNATQRLIGHSMSVTVPNRLRDSLPDSAQQTFGL